MPWYFWIPAVIVAGILLILGIDYAYRKFYTDDPFEDEVTGILGEERNG